jgi:hypothetical protein
MHAKLPLPFRSDMKLDVKTIIFAAFVFVLALLAIV